MSSEHKSGSSHHAHQSASSPSVTKPYFVFQKTIDISDKYDCGEVFSRGHTGSVFPGTLRDIGEVRAVKSIKKPQHISDEHRKMFFDAVTQEVKVLRQINHPNVVQLHDVFEDDEQLYLVMEMCSGGELFEKIQKTGRFSERDASTLLRQITEAVAFMHTNGVAHCDLKPENLLFSDHSESAPIKIVDFGMSKALKWRQYFRSICGTPYYVAPEVLRGHYDESCDMWSIGVIMFVLLFGFPPFHSSKGSGKQSNREIYDKVARGFTPKVKPGYGAWFPEKIRASEEAKDLLSHLLVMDVAKRMTANEALSHHWMKGENVSDEPLDEEVFRSMMTFSQGLKFKQTVTDFMVDQLSADQVASLSQAFKQMDLNGDGTITYDELRQALKKVNVNIDERMVEETLKKMDLDGDGRIDYRELTHARVFRRLTGKETRLWSAFRKLDKNGDGKISADELREAMGDDKELNQAIQLITELDKNKDGMVDYEEFITVWKTDVERHRSGD